MRSVAYLFVVSAAAATDELNLLQISSAKTSQSMGVHSIKSKNMYKKSKQCEEDSQGRLYPNSVDDPTPPPAEHNFGCNGQTQFHLNKGTRQCSFWGEPHISSTFGTQSGGNRGEVNEGHKGMLEVHYDAGLYRMARAVDQSWEIQIFSCGMIAGAAVVRFGNTTIEVAMPPNENDGGKPIFVVNGVKVPHGDLPGELPDGSFLGPHHKVTFGRDYKFWDENSNRIHYGWFTWGSCADDPKGQVRVEITSSYRPDMGNLMNVLVEAAEGSYVDGPEEEKVSTCPGEHWINTKVPPYHPIARALTPDESLFTNPGDICASCGKVWEKWGMQNKNLERGKDQCNSVKQLDKAPRADEMCESTGLSMDKAKAACSHLTNKPIFFEDCVFDVCATGSVAAADNALAEEEEEEPEPQCVEASADCNPTTTCCDDDASRGLNLGNVVQNNLAGSDVGPKELRYGQVIDGIDLVITCPGYVSQKGNAANGVKGVLGSLNVDSGSRLDFTFTFVETGTNNPTSPGNAIISFLDLDQAKKKTQRESLKICGLGSPIVTSNSELDTNFSNGCATAKSTGLGTGKDNPDDPATMDDMQRSRTIAFPLRGQSSFTAKLGVSKAKKGKSGRIFLFTGHPTVACG